MISLPRQQSVSAPPLTSVPRRSHALLPLLLAFGLVKLLLQSGITLLSVHAGYGMFRDEFYYLVCGRRLAAGYVDQPPLVALQARATELLFGYHHLVLFRLFPAIAGALMVVLTGLITQALGGGRRAAAIAMLSVLTVPVFVATQSFLSMNAWEPVFWMGAVLALLRLLATSARATQWWVLLGVSSGLALENKASAAFFLVALVLALACTRARRFLLSRGFLLALAITAVLILPNLLWQMHFGFPTWEWLRTVQQSNKDVVLSPPRFLLAQFLMLSPLHLLLWLPGLALLLRQRTWRPAGVLVLVFVAIMMALHAKDYYVAPIYPLLFAAGGVFWDRWINGSQPRLALVYGYGALMTLGLAVTLPFAVPILSPATYIRYSHLTHFAPIESEQHPASPLPEFFSDFLGWRDLTNGVARVYRSLPADERARTGIFAGNYGEASAITVLGKTLGLPAAISGHQNYWMWGPRGYSGAEMIVVTPEPLATIQKFFRTCTVEDYQDSPYSMPSEKRYIYLCRDRRQSYAAAWDSLKVYR